MREADPHLYTGWEGLGILRKDLKALWSPEELHAWKKIDLERLAMLLTEPQDRPIIGNDLA